MSKKHIRVPTLLYGVALLFVAVIATLLALGFHLNTQIIAIASFAFVGIIFIIGAINAARSSKSS